MSHRRLTIFLAAAAVLLALGAAPVAAGGSATAEVTSGLDEPPVAGEERELRVLLLQHGVTPVDDGEVLITGVLPGSDESVTAEATSLGDGAWSATIAFPSAGEWQIRVTHSELATPGRMAVTVADAGLALPSVAAPIAGLAALALVLFLVVVIARRPRPAAAGTTPAEPSMHRG